VAVVVPAVLKVAVFVGPFVASHGVPERPSQLVEDVFHVAPDAPFHVPGAAIAVAEPAATIAAAMARDATRCARLREIAIAAGDGRDADVAVQVEDICMLLWQFLE